MTHGSDCSPLRSLAQPTRWYACLQQLADAGTGDTSQRDLCRRSQASAVARGVIESNQHRPSSLLFFLSFLPTHLHTCTHTHTQPCAQWIFEPKSPSTVYLRGTCGIQYSTSSMSCFNTTLYSAFSSLSSWLSSPPELRASSLCSWISYLNICLLGRVRKPHSAKSSNPRFSELP